MDPFKSAPIREKFRTIHYIFYVEYERLEFLVNYPTTLLNMEFVDKEESKKTQSIQVMDLDELEKRLSKGYRFYKKIRTTLNLKEEWDFVKLKILFMRQYSQLFVDGIEPDRGYFYLEKAADLVEKRRRIHRNPYEDDVHFYRYLVEIDRANFFILTNQYRQLLLQCEVFIECASRLEEYRRKPFNILIPFRIYVGCGMIYEFFNQENDIIVNTFLRGVQIIEKNSDDVGRYFLQNDLLIYVQAYVKIVKCKIRLKDYENAEQWARSTLKFIQDNTYLLRLEPESKVVKKIQTLHQQAITELVAMNQLKLETQRQQQLQLQQLQGKKFLIDENGGSLTGKHSNVGSPQHIRKHESNGIDLLIDDPMLVIDKSVEVSDQSFSKTEIDDTQNATTNNQNETQQMQQTTQSIDPGSSRLDITHINHYQQFNEAISRKKRLEEISRQLIGVQNIQSHFKPISQIKQEIAENNEQIDVPIVKQTQQLNKEFYNYPASSLLSPISDSHQVKVQEKEKEKEDNRSKNNLGSSKKEAMSLRSSEEDEGEEEEDEEYSLGDSDDDGSQMISIFGKRKDKKNKRNNTTTNAKQNNSKKDTNEEIENDITNKLSNYNNSDASKISSQTLVNSPSNAGMLKSGRFSSQAQINSEIKAITENGEEEDSPMIPRSKGTSAGVAIPAIHRFQPITPVSLKNLCGDIPRLSFHEATDQLLDDHTNNAHSAEVLDSQIPVLSKKSSQNKLLSEGNSNQTEQPTTVRSISGVESFPQIQHRPTKNPATTDKEFQPILGIQQIQLLRITSMKQIPEAQEDDSPRRKTQEYHKMKNNDADGWNNINTTSEKMDEMKEFEIQSTKAVSKYEIKLSDGITGQDNKEKDDKKTENNLFEVFDRSSQQQLNGILPSLGDQKDMFRISVFDAGTEANQDKTVGNPKLEEQTVIRKIGSEISQNLQSNNIDKPITTITVEQEEQGTLSVPILTSSNPNKPFPQLSKGLLNMFPFMKASIDIRKSSMLDAASDGIQSHFGSQPRKSSTNYQNSFDQTIETLNSCQTIGLPQVLENNNQTNSNNNNNTNSPSIPLNLLSPQLLRSHQAVGLPRKSIFSDQKNEIVGLVVKNARETLNSQEDSSVSSKPSNEEDQSQVYHSPRRRRQSQNNEGKEQLFKRFITSTDIRAKQKGDWKRLQLNTYFKGSSISTLLPSAVTKSPGIGTAAEQKDKQIGQKLTNVHNNEQTKTPGRVLTARKGIGMELPSENQNNNNHNNNGSSSSTNRLELRQKLMEQLKSHHRNHPSGISTTTHLGNSESNPPNYFVLWKSSLAKGSQTDRQGGGSSSNGQYQYKNNNEKSSLNEQKRYYANKLDAGYKTDRRLLGEHGSAMPRPYSSQNHHRTVTQATIASFRASPGRIHQEECVFPGKKAQSVQVSPFRERVLDHQENNQNDNNTNNSQISNHLHKHDLFPQQKSQDCSWYSKGTLIPHRMTAEERHCFHQLIERKKKQADQKGSNNSAQQECLRKTSTDNEKDCFDMKNRATTPNVQRMRTPQKEVMFTPQRDNRNLKINILITPPPQSNQNSLLEGSERKIMSQKSIQLLAKTPNKKLLLSQ